jgi:hypothetical protein
LQQGKQSRLGARPELPVYRAGVEIEKRQPALDIAQARKCLWHRASFRVQDVEDCAAGVAFSVDFHPEVTRVGA